MESNTERLGEMNTGQVLDYSIELFKRNIKQIALIMTFMYFPFIVFLQVSFHNVSDLTIGTIIGAFISENPETINQTIQDWGENYYYQTILWNIFNWTVLLVINAVIMKLVYLDMVGKKKSLMEITKGCFKKYFSLLLSKFMQKIMFNLILFIMIVILVLIGVLTGFVVYYVSVVFKIITLLIVAILAMGIVFGAFYLIVRVFFVTFPVVLEGRGVFEGIERSFSLTKNNVIHSKMVLGMGYMLQMILPTIIMMGLTSLFLIDKSLFENLNLDSLLKTLLLVNYFIYPFPIVFSTVLYVNFKMKNEAFDLELKLEEMIENEKPKNGWVD